MTISTDTANTPTGYIARASSSSSPWSTAVARAPSMSDAIDNAVAELEDAAARGAVSTSMLRPRPPAPGESLDAWLRWHDLLDHGFAFDELVRPGDRRRAMPPRKLWPNIAATLAAAMLLRSWMIEAGARGLVVRAAYRAGGGVSSSRHTMFAALDLDLTAEDQRRHMGAAYLGAGARLYRQHADDLRLGVGSYHPPGTWSTRRLHVDAGTGSPRPDAWQIHGGTGPDPEYVKPPAIITINERCP